MSDEIECEFPCAKPYKRKGKKAKKQNSLAFKLSVETETKCKDLKSQTVAPKQEPAINSRFEDLDDFEYDDNMESFYSETHEDEGGMFKCYEHKYNFVVYLLVLSCIIYSYSIYYTYTYTLSRSK